MGKPALLFACAALVFADAASAAEGPACKLELIAVWQVRPKSYLPVIDGSINGQKVGILLDTGASGSVIQRAAVAKLGLTTFSLNGRRSLGVGGETLEEGVKIDELRIGNGVRRDWPARVVGEHDFKDDVALLLGQDFFRQLDVEFDLAANIVRLFQPKDCERGFLAYWAANALAVPLEGTRTMRVSVMVDGRSMLALLDSGATSSLLTMEAARELGVTPQTPGVIRGGCLMGLGRERPEYWIGRFQTFAIGDQVIRNPNLGFAPLFQGWTFEEFGSRLRRQMRDLPDMVLGADFLRAHRVLISHSQGRMYFTYTGAGTVFTIAPRKNCPGDQTK